MRADSVAPRRRTAEPRLEHLLAERSAELSGNSFASVEWGTTPADAAAS